MLGYDEIKELAKNYKATVKDFYYLADDPYYMNGNPNERKKGEWFAELYQQYWQTLTDKMVRSLHYAILHHEVYLPDKTRYINLDSHYQKLLEAAKVARYLGLVPMDIIDEKKNIPAVFVSQNKPLPKLDIDTQYWSSIEIESFPTVPHYDLTPFPDNQRYHLEIWCEKSYSSLRALASRYGAVWQQSQGEQTVECANMLTERRKQYRKPIRVFYISDFDPAGTSMPAAVSRKLEYMLEDIRGNPDEPDVKLFNLALTQEQVEAYSLPRTPLKATEKRKDAWQAVHGQDAVELNALEAQPQFKGELIRIVEEAIKRYYDNGLGVEAWRAQGKFSEKLEGIQQDVYWRYPDLDMMRAEYERLREEVAPKLQWLNDEIAKTWESISEALEEERPDIDEYLREHPLPEAKMAQELENPLYDSNRDYFTQLAVYKRHQGKRIVF